MDWPAAWAVVSLGALLRSASAVRRTRVFRGRAPGRPYDAEIAYVDAELGKLLKPLDRSRTAIVITSDHGEALGEHGEPDHGFFLYDATLRVPLLWRLPA